MDRFREPPMTAGTFLQGANYETPGTLLTETTVSSTLPEAPSAVWSSSGYGSSSEGGADGLPQGAQGQPGAKPDAAATQPQTGGPSKRILFIVPNYRSVRVGAKLPPQTVREKFKTAFEDAFDPADFALAGLVAAESDARGSTPEFGSGGVAFGRYYWHSFADQATENFAVEFIVPSLTHEDTRFYTLGPGFSFKRRAVYSLTRILITRNDSGHETANLSELLGAGLAAGASSRYYPASQRDAGSVLGQYGLDLGIDAASFALREFDSDIAHILSRKHSTAPAQAVP